jgi:hypothetical protein
LTDPLLADAIDLLPWWARAIALVVPPATAYAAVRLAAGAARLAAPRRPPVDAHWSETARWAYARRLELGVACCSTAAIAILLGSLVAPTAAFGGATGRNVLTYLALVAGSAAAERKLTRTLLAGSPHFDGSRGAAWCRFMGAPSALFLFGSAIVATSALPLGATAVAVTLGFVALPLATSRINAFPLWSRCGLVEPAPERLVRATDAATDDLRAPRVKVATARFPTPAKAAGLVGETLVVGRSLPELLDDDELQALMRRAVVSGVGSAAGLRTWLLGALAVSTSMLAIPTGRSYGTAAGVGAGVVAVAVCVAAARLSASRNSVGANAPGAGPGAGDASVWSAPAARALEKIHRACLMPAILSARKTTPPNLYDGMIAAGVAPDFPRPHPPVASRRVSFAVLSVASAWLLGFIFSVGPLQRAEVDGRVDIALSAALVGVDAAALGDMGVAASNADRPADALKYFRAELALDPQSPYAAVDVARTTARLGDVAATTAAVAAFLDARDAYLARLAPDGGPDEAEEHELGELSREVRTLVDLARRAAEGR